MRNVTPLLLLASAFWLCCCTADDDYTPPVFSEELALSRLEANGTIVYTGHANAVKKYRVQANGTLQPEADLPVTGQVQDLWVAENKLVVALPEKAAVYGLTGTAFPQWQYQIPYFPLYTRLANTGGLLSKLNIQDTLAGNPQINSYYQQGTIQIYNHSGQQPLHQFATDYRNSLALAATQNTFIIGEEEQVLVYPSDSLVSGRPGQTLNLRLLGLQATTQGWVICAREAPRSLQFYRLQLGQLVLQSQLPLAP